MGALIVISKLTFTAFFIYLLSEIARRSTIFASLLAAAPTTTVLAGILLYWETGDVERVASFTTSVLWLIGPSLVFFIAFPILLRRGISFGTAVAISIAITAVSYTTFFQLVRWFDIKI